MRGRRAALLLFCILFTALSAFARAEEIETDWAARFGADGTTEALCALPAAGGGVLVAGTTDASDSSLGSVYGGRDALILKIGTDGTPLFSARFGGSGDDAFTDALETADGGCVLIGTTTSTDEDAKASRGLSDGFIVRLEADGGVRWIKCLGGTQDDVLLSVAVAEDGQILVSGRSQSRNGDLRANMGGWDAFAALLSDVDGKPEWVIRHGQAGDDTFSKVRAMDNGWLLLGVIAEETAGSGADGQPVFRERPIALMLSKEHEEIFLTMLGGTGTNRLIDVQQTDAGWLFLGETNSSSVLMPTPRGGMDAWLLHLRDTGSSTLFQRTYGGSSDEAAHSLLQLPTGQIIVLATTQSDDGQVTGAHGAADLWLLRIASGGTLEWQQTIGGGAPSIPAGFIQTADGGFLVAGHTTAQDGDIGHHAPARTGFVSRLAPNGNLLDTRLVGAGAECTLRAILRAEDGAYVIGSLHGEGGAAETLYVIKLAAI